jgi:hypothetical protein
MGFFAEAEQAERRQRDGLRAGRAQAA